MLIQLAAVLLLSWSGHAQQANEYLASDGVCSEFIVSHEYASAPVSLNYVVTSDDSTGDVLFHGEVTYDGEGYVAFGISPDGRMDNSLAVIGLPDGNSVAKYNIAGKAAALITELDASQQTLRDASIEQTGGQTILRFTKLVEEPDEISINLEGSNFFIVAAAPTGDALSYHLPTGRGTDEFDAPGLCVLGGGGGGSSGLLPQDVLTSDLCSEFLVSHTYENIPYTLNYVITATAEDQSAGNGFFHGEVVYEGQGYVAFAISETGGMDGSLAVIGLPDDNTVTKYNLGGKAASLVNELDESQQTLIDTSIEQNSTHTVLRFTKFLQEPDELSINLNGPNYFLVAGGATNELGYHTFTGKGSNQFAEPTPCETELQLSGSSGSAELQVGDVITVEGYLMDTYCINLGVLLDAQQYVTLQSPDMHSLHCLLDVERCYTSPYEILIDPAQPGQNYTRGYRLDAESQEEVLAFARGLGRPGAGFCTTCTGDETGLERGLRIEVEAEVVALADEEGEIPPIIRVIDVEHVVVEGPTVLEVGDIITVEGYVMDYYCIDLGVLLDAQHLVTLESPDMHSLHCLLDVERCYTSPYEILIDPEQPGETYTRGYRLDAESQERVLEFARGVGRPGAGFCTTCTGEENGLERGLRLQLEAEVVALAEGDVPPIIRIIDVEHIDTSVTDDSGMDMDDTAVTPMGPVNCSEFQVHHTYDGIPLTLSYVVLYDEESGAGNFSGQVVYEGQGWVGFGISPDGRMVGSNAVIGLPDEEMSASNPGIYTLGGQTVAGVTLVEDQTLLEGSIEQNDTHTVLRFVKLFDEPGLVPIDPMGANFFLAAAGIGNDLGFHAFRGSVGLGLSPCTEEGGGGSTAAISVDTDGRQSMFAAHGVLAVLAWGILVPLAIGSSVARDWIPGDGVWFKIHRAFNSFVLLLTIILFALAVSAIEQTGGNNPQHFQSAAGPNNKHRTIGLVVFILAIIQALGGIFRPHLPPKPEGEEAAGEENKPEKSTVRKVWEIVHPLTGYSLLGMSWYQCHSGLTLYAGRFSADNLAMVFWIVVGILSAIIFVAEVAKFFKSSGN